MYNETIEVDDIERISNSLEENLKVINIPKHIAVLASLETDFKVVELKEKRKDYTISFTCTLTDSVILDKPKPIDCLYIAYDNTGKGWVFNREDLGVIESVFPELWSKDLSNSSEKYEYIFESKNDILCEDTKISAKEDNSISRPDETIEITSLTKVNSNIPVEWFGVTSNDKNIYLRERSGAIKLRISEKDEDPITGKLILHIFIGREHPGTLLKPNEILSIVKSFDFIEFNNPDEVEKKRLDKFYENFIDEL